MKKSRICSSMEQSKKLVELGLDPLSADMCWKTMCYSRETFETLESYEDALADLDRMVEEDEPSHYHFMFDATPAWSVQALLDVMPEFINGDRIEVELSKVYNWSPEQDLVYIGCIRNERTMDGVFYSYGETAIDAIVGLAFKLLEADQQ